METLTPKRFVSVAIFHSIVDDTDLGPSPVVERDLDENPAEDFDTIEHMLDGGAFAAEVGGEPLARVG